jgi:hypothetical protein
MHAGSQSNVLRGSRRACRLASNDNCLQVCALAAKWPFSWSDHARIEHEVTSKSAIEVSIPIPC